MEKLAIKVVDRLEGLRENRKDEIIKLAQILDTVDKDLEAFINKIIIVKRSVFVTFATSSLGFVNSLILRYLLTRFLT